MAIQWLQYDGFDYIANLYANTKPLVSKCHTLEEDIRPIGDRNRKYERIKKMNDKCYILQDGYHSGDEVFGGYNYYGDNGYLKGKPTEIEMLNLAPIVWYKDRDGKSDYIKIRNGTGAYAHNGRYSFLDRCLPQGLRFIIRNGKHFIKTNGEEYFLAKSNTVAKHAVPEKHKGIKDGYTTRDDDVSLLFQRMGSGSFEFVSGGKPIPKPPRQIVDKKAKAKMKDAISAFRDWAGITFPMLPVDDREYRSRLMTELSEHTNGTFHQYSWDAIDTFAELSELSRNIISDENHPLRLHLAYFMFNSIEERYTEDMDQRETRAYVMSVFNRRINRVCNFTKTVKG